MKKHLDCSNCGHGYSSHAPGTLSCRARDCGCPSFTTADDKEPDPEPDDTLESLKSLTTLGACVGFGWWVLQWAL